MLKKNSLYACQANGKKVLLLLFGLSGLLAVAALTYGHSPTKIYLLFFITAILSADYIFCGPGSLLGRKPTAYRDLVNQGLDHVRQYPGSDLIS